MVNGNQQVFDTAVAGIVTFLFFVTILILRSLNFAYDIVLTDQRLLRCKSLVGTSEYLLREIEYLRLAREDTGEGIENYGIVGHARGKMRTLSLSHSQFAKLNEFFQSVVKLDPRIQLRVDREP
jgi:hypothetical protein